MSAIGKSIRKDPRERFGSRVENYARFRPGYPDELIDHLLMLLDDAEDSTVADVGSGTGILTLPLLEAGLEVYAVEPNREMRERAESELSGMPGFHSVAGEAAATGLPDRSVDLITVAQAFHWFAVEDTVREFSRVLRRGGAVALIWNSRRTSGEEFHSGYESALKTWCPDYRVSTHKNHSLVSIGRVFQGWKIHLATFPNSQHLDFEGLKGRVESSSYAPTAGSAQYNGLMKALSELFFRFETEGWIRFDYTTELYVLRNPEAATQ